MTINVVPSLVARFVGKPARLRWDRFFVDVTTKDLVELRRGSPVVVTEILGPESPGGKATAVLVDAHGRLLLTQFFSGDTSKDLYWLSLINS